MSDELCRTRYPVLLIHGTGFRDWRICNYWGRIPEVLRAHGATVYLGEQDSWATVEENAKVLSERISQILEETGREKIHLIAHSKGGLEARYLASSMKMGTYLASVSTISTPNHGSKTMDRICQMPNWMFRTAGFLVNSWYHMIGDANPDFCTVCLQFTTAWAEEFNRANPDAPGVLYRSYAGAMSCSRSDILMWWQNLIVNHVEGENDGLVTVASAQWTGFHPVWRGTGGRGISHLDEVDFRRRPLRGKDGPIDPANYYVEMLAELKARNL